MRGVPGYRVLLEVEGTLGSGEVREQTLRFKSEGFFRDIAGDNTLTLIGRERTLTGSKRTLTVGVRALTTRAESNNEILSSGSKRAKPDAERAVAYEEGAAPVAEMLNPVAAISCLAAPERDPVGEISLPDNLE